MNTCHLVMTAMIVCGVLSSGLPALADAHHDRKHAQEERADARKAERHARESSAKGHGFMARLHAKHAEHERERAAKHDFEAKHER